MSLLHVLRFPRFSSIRWACGLMAFAFLLSCHSDHSAPTQPVVNPSPTPVGAAPTPTPSAAAHMVNVGQGGGNAFMDLQTGSTTTTVRAGQTVQWVWVSGFHSTTSGNCCSPDGRWDSGAMSGGAFSHTFATPGNFPYYCTVHGTMMTGMVVVMP